MADKTIGVLLMAYGAASSLDEIEPYLQDIRGGRPTSPELVEEVKERYRLMGGSSPLLDITNQQAQAVEEVLNKELGAVLRRKVLRGGSWDSFPAECRSAIRMESNPPQGWAQNWGFRVVIVCTPEEIKEAANAAGAAPKGR